jgi:hypothetical protein
MLGNTEMRREIFLKRTLYNGVREEQQDRSVPPRNTSLKEASKKVIYSTILTACGVVTFEDDWLLRPHKAAIFIIAALRT